VVEIQERVAKVEGRVEGHARMLTDVAGAMRHLEARMDQRFTSVDERFTSVDLRFTALEGRLTALDAKLDQKIGALDAKLDHRFETLDQKMDSHFRWLVGIQFAMLIAMLASFIGG
jgi:hypothetical protein